MKITVNSSGQVTSLVDYLLVQNANFLNTNKIILELDNTFTQAQIDNFYTARLTVDLADGRTLYNLLMAKTYDNGITQFVHEVENDSQIFSCKGSISVSIQVLSQTNGVLATIKARAFVQENTGISSAEEYDSVIAQIDSQYIQPLEAIFNVNLLDVKNSSWSLFPTPVAETKSIDDFLEIGSYFVNKNIVPDLPINYGTLYVLKVGSFYIQLLFSVENELLQRTNSAGVFWSEWIKFANTNTTDRIASDLATLEQTVRNIVIGSQTDLFLIVNTLPEIGLPNKIYLVPIANGEDPNLFDEWIWVNSKWEYFGQSSLNIALRDYVKFTDYATDNKAGVLRAISTFGFTVDQYGRGQIVKAEKADIDSQTQEYKPLTPKLLSYALKIGITTNTETLTAEEKLNACNWLGAVEKTYFENALASVNALNGYQITITKGEYTIMFEYAGFELPTKASFLEKISSSAFTYRYLSNGRAFKVDSSQSPAIMQAHYLVRYLVPFSSSFSFFLTDYTVGTIALADAIISISLEELNSSDVTYSCVPLAKFM